jgi:LmbE family N-acetylglucosaminyl deacetylase
VLAAEGEGRAAEARASAAAFLDGVAASRVEIHGFRDGFLPYVGGEVKDVFEDLKDRVDPQVVFTHSHYDLHQDHRLACELTWNTFRNHLILEYEIPKVDGDLGRPNAFFPLTTSVVERKLALLDEHFPSQAGRHWFDRDTFAGLMRLRGMEAVAPERFAEAFTARKAVLAP